MISFTKKHDLTFPSFLVARITGGKLIPSDVKQAAEVSQWVNIADQEVRYCPRPVVEQANHISIA